MVISIVVAIAKENLEDAQGVALTIQTGKTVSGIVTIAKKESHPLQVRNCFR